MNSVNNGLCALVSVHDVMPETRTPISLLLQQLQRVEGLHPQHITLLVVPGKSWQTADLNWLQSLAHAGHPLAGHGWSHRAPPPGTLYHQVHSLLLSRRAAEHLSRPPAALRQRVQACHDWFAHHSLPHCGLYVPPAWANGKLDWATWHERPFSQLETLHGVTSLDTGQHQPLPLTGYEADTAVRAWFLARFNHCSKAIARHRNRPLRISLHPFDLTYGLAQNALQDLAAATRFLNYQDLPARH